MSVTIILQSPNTATITQTGAVSATIQHTGAVSATIQQIVGQGVSVQNIVPNAVTINSSMAASTWGSITGTITDQTDLVNYVSNNTIQDGQEVLDSLNEGGLEAIELGTADTPLKVFNVSVTDADGLRGYSLPLPLDISDKYGYFLFTDSDGSLGWKPFPLEFLTGQAEEAKVDGGDF